MVNDTSRQVVLMCVFALTSLIFLYDTAEAQFRAPPQMQWHRAYGGSGEESHPHFVIETHDGSFVMVGETGFVHDKTARIFVVKTDGSGNL